MANYAVKVAISFDTWLEIEAENEEQAEEKAREIIADRERVMTLYDGADYVQEDVLEVE